MATVLALSLTGVGTTGVAHAAEERSPGGLPESAPDADRTFAPAMDYDVDGCYPTPAIGPDGKINPGKNIGGAVNGECRDEVDLDDANVYSRSKCDNGWCAYMYGYYFEKDQTVAGPGGNGHKHDWEHVVVWVQNDTPVWVAVSQHGGYHWQHRDQIPWEGTHAKVVYHKDAGTHLLRHADASEQPENHKGVWHLPKVIGWDDYPPGFRDKLVQADFGSATFKLRDQSFAEHLRQAQPSEVAFDPNA